MKFENTRVMNFEGALRGMRNPMDSWDKSDSEFFYSGGESVLIGENDMKLALALIKGGSEHRKFLRQIMVCVDITAPLYIFSEMDTYKVGTTANSCSTMHKLHAYPFSDDMFEQDKSNWNAEDEKYWKMTLHYLEMKRQDYLAQKSGGCENAYAEFRKMKQALPTSFLQKRTITLNYEVIRTMCHQRKNHRLREWSVDFINWVKMLPYAEEFLLESNYEEVDA